MGGVSKNGSLHRKTISHCSQCQRAIRSGQEAVWQTGKNMGLVHTTCARDPEAQPVDTEAVDKSFFRPDLRE